MTAMHAISIRRTGMVTSVGHSAPAACAAIRAKVANPTETRFIDRAGDWITGHSVDLSRSVRGVEKLAWMGALAADECMRGTPSPSEEVPLIMCVAEEGRPGRFAGLDDALFLRIEQLLSTRFHRDSVVIAEGRNGLAVALRRAHGLIESGACATALILGVDTFLTAETIGALLDEDRLLLPTNSNGFMPGEAAAAILVGSPHSRPSLQCLGIGFGIEPATLGSGQPLRGIGMRQAVRAALADSGLTGDDLHFRVADVSGEQYYFKEASLCLAGLFRRPKETFEFWHFAEATGEVGAAAGPLAVGVLEAAHRKSYAPGRISLCHFSDAGSKRSALIFRHGE